MTYLLITSKSKIPIDEDEIEKVLKCLSSGTICVLRKGIFNPSFFDSIVEDVDRENGFNRDHGQGKYLPAEPRGKLLEDAFAEVRKRLAVLGSPNGIKQLGE